MYKEDMIINDKRDVLVAARAKIVKGWIQNHYAMKGDAPTNTLDKDATCFCSVGAIWSMVPDVPDPSVVDDAVWHLSKHIRNTFGAHSVISWNDDPERTQAEVLAAFDAAIQTA